MNLLLCSFLFHSYALCIHVRLCVERWILDKLSIKFRDKISNSDSFELTQWKVEFVRMWSIGDGKV